MIKDCSAAKTDNNQVVVDINYDEAKLDPLRGHSRVVINTRSNGYVDSVTIQEYDEDGNLVTSSVWWK